MRPEAAMTWPTGISIAKRPAVMRVATSVGHSLAKSFPYPDIMNGLHTEPTRISGRVTAVLILIDAIRSLAERARSLTPNRSASIGMTTPPSMYGNHIRALNHLFAALKVPI